MGKSENEAPLVIAEGYWMNSPMSVARHTGLIVFRGHQYIVVDKRGHDIFECSKEAEKEGREKAIEPGEPADLCRLDFKPTYRKLGRERVIELIREGKGKKEMEAIAKAESRRNK